MLIINKYLTQEILKYFALILAMVIGIYVAVDFFEKIDDFMEAGLPFSKVLSFFIFKIPFIVAQIMPVGILLAILVMLGLMNKNNEIIALKSSGVSTYFLLRPVLVIGSLASLILFLLSELIVPVTVGRANTIWNREVHQEVAVSSDEKNIWIKGNRTITHIKYYHSREQSIHGITLNVFGRDFRMTRRVDAKRGVYQQGEWRLYDIMEQTLDQKDGKYRVTFYEDRLEPLEFMPEDLKRVIKRSEEMSFKELWHYINKVEDEGYDATILRVDLNAKFAFPLVCLVFSLVGVGIALRGRIKEGLPVNIAFGIGIAFLYWIFYSFCVSLGYGEMLPPWVAVWTANFIFLCFGIFLLLHAD